jgi:glycosyl transferase family 25
MSPELAITQPHLGRPLSRGEVGCLHSHLMALGSVVANQLPLACIVEDDVEYGEDFGRVLQAIGAKRQQSWDIVLLGHHSARHAPAQGAEIAFARKALTRERQIGRVVEFAMGAYAYVVTTRGAAILTEFADPLRMPMDWVTGYSPAGDARLYAVTPPCATPVGSGADVTTIEGRAAGPPRDASPIDHARAIGGKLWLLARKAGLWPDSYVRDF